MSPETLDTFLSGENGMHFIDAGTITCSDLLTGSLDVLLVHAHLGEHASKDTALTELARAFDMPRWFGHNWDALEDCLTDLEWLPEQPIVLCLIGALEDAADRDTLLDILQSACQYWQDAQRKFHVLMDLRLKHDND